MGIYRHIILLTISTVLITLSMLYLNNINILIRIRELKVYLQKLDRSEDRIYHIRLVMKYKLNSSLYDSKMSDAEADIIESRMNSISTKEKNHKIIINENRLFQKAAIGSINIIRFFTGKQFIKDLNDSKSNSSLYTAYFFERNHLYEKALQYYKASLQSYDIDRSTESGILLHMGFCHAMLSEYNNAKKKYTRILRNFNNNDAAPVAAILLQYLEKFHSEQNIILAGADTPFEKSKKLLKLMAYKETEAIVQELKKKPEYKNDIRLDYITARTYEEQGKTTEALEKYSHIIKKSKTSKYSRLANRRIYQTGISLHNPNLINIASGINKTLNDPHFSRMAVFKSKQTVYNKTIRMNIPSELINCVSKISDTKKPAKSIPKRVIIKTNDGNTFYGTIIHENPKFVKVKTIIGEIKIERKKIKDYSVE